MRRKIVAGNWKMNQDFLDGLRLANAILAQAPSWANQAVEVVVCPPFVHLHTIASMFKEQPKLKVGAQNCHHAPKGAYTGEISLPMLQSVGVDYVIIGHSERRQYFHEDDAFLAQKVQATLQAGLQAIFCCGEPLEVREQGQEEAYVQAQLKAALSQLPQAQLSQLIIAYEPIWAIGTGKTASPEQAQAMHQFIRGVLAQLFSPEIAAAMPILYGGSCNAQNAGQIFQQPDVDGGLIGGASLLAEDFGKIIAQRIKPA